MKDIDLLPEWYKSNKRKQVTLRGQYIALAGVLLIVVVWNFVAGNSISKAQAELARAQGQQAQAAARLNESKRIESKINFFKSKADVLKAIDSGINIGNVLSELGCLIDAKIVLSELEFKAEEFEQSKQNKTRVAGIRVAGSAGDNELLLGSVRFKVFLRGLAAETGDVGQLVRKLEGSPYFRSVTLAYSKNKLLNTSGRTNDEARPVSEFEICCELANYRLE